MKVLIPNNKKIFITGGAGYLGKKLIEKLYSNNEIIVYSRDEAKHYELKSIYPKINFILGDIRDKDLITLSSRGVDIGIFAASVKQISACDENPSEAVKTIINDAINSKHAAIENCFESATFISTDKSRAATTIYGSLKFAAGEQFILKNNYEKNSNTKLSIIIYGNVLNSTGSKIPMIWKAIKSKSELTLFSKEMTRFLIEAEEALDLIFKGLMIDGASIIPKSNSCNIFDLFQIYQEKFDLKFKIGSPRVGEKIHEILASEEEIKRLSNSECNTFFILRPTLKNLKAENHFCILEKDYSSEDCTISKNQLKKMLEKFNYFKPF